MYQPPKRCPLCESIAVSQIQTIPVEDIVEVYRQVFGDLDVRREFAQLRDIVFSRCGDCDLLFFSPSVTGSESFYELLQQFDWYYLTDKAEYRFAAELIPAGAQILDIGCGDGAFARLLPQVNFVGLEFSGAARERAAERGLEVYSESVELHASRFPARYDAVCAFQVLEHIADVRNFVEASAACAREGGLVIFSVPAADSFAGTITNYALNLPPHHVTWWTDECLKRMGPRFGLDLVQLEPELLAPIHHPLYARARLLSFLTGRARAGGPRVRIDRSFRFRALSRIASAFSRMAPRRLVPSAPPPRGHSVTAVYRKGRATAYEVDNRTQPPIA
jgi:SAM-dependent methyltransferase